MNSVTPIVTKYFDETITLTYLEEAIDIIEKKKTNIRLVLWNYRRSSISLLKFTLSLIPKTPFIVFTDQTDNASDLILETLNFKVEIVSKTHVLDELPMVLEKIKTKVSKEENVDPSEFVQMSIELFKMLKPLDADIFFRLNENKYIRIYRKDDSLNETDLARYIQKSKGGYFYVKAVEIVDIMAKQQKAVDELLQSEEALSPRDRTAVDNHLEMIQELTRKFGVTPQIQVLTKKVTSLTLKVLGSNPKLSSVLKQMSQTWGSYSSSHSFALAEICCSIALKLGWNSRQTFLKLTLAAFLHDISLPDDRLAKIQTLSELNRKSDLTPSEVSLYKNHPSKSASYVREFHELPPDVDTIVMDHHERPDGTGFPRGLTYQQISPLSCVFIVAHDILSYLMRSKESKPMKEFLNSRQELYSNGVFKEILRALQKEQSHKTKAAV